MKQNSNKLWEIFLLSSLSFSQAAVSQSAIEDEESEYCVNCYEAMDAMPSTDTNIEPRKKTRILYILLLSLCFLPLCALKSNLSANLGFLIGIIFIQIIPRRKS